MNDTIVYEAIVIGSGQGGTPLAAALAGKGMKTALVEMREVGGTCVNYGCTPTKTMVASARVAHVARRAADYGVRLEPAEAAIDLSKVRQRKRDIVASFRGGSERHIEQTEKLDLHRGRARFTGPHSITVTTDGGKELSLDAPKIFINTGTRPVVPKIPGLDEVDYLNNESIMELDRVPEHLMVLGGGYIGAEFAQMFRRFGSKVTIIQRARKLLPREDPEISDAVAELFRGEGIEIILEAETLSATRRDGEPSQTRGALQLKVHSNGTERVISGSHLLVATGRTPNTDDLGLEIAGITVSEKGFVKVNDRLETDTKGVWALGDVKGGPAFTHISYDDYRVLVRNVIDGANLSTKGRLVPYTVFIDPQLGRVGMTEKEAKAAGRKVRVASMPMSWVARALEINETAGLMKAVVDGDTDSILGFAMLGIDAGEIAGAVQIAMMGGLPYSALRDGAFSHPTTLESLNNLFMQIA